jgi:hypothetical protein
MAGLYIRELLMRADAARILLWRYCKGSDGVIGNRQQIDRGEEKMIFVSNSRDDPE